jgi:RNA polymerase sigma-70 factor (ECF subfamily)
MGVNPPELEDAVQEAFMVVHRHLDSFEGRAKFTTWLFRICFNVARDRRRRARNRPEVLVGLELLDSHDPAPNAETLASLRDDLALLERSLQKLSLELRAVFILFELEEFTCEQIAETLQVPLGTVYSRLRRARELFKRSLSAARAAELPPLLREGA